MEKRTKQWVIGGAVLTGIVLLLAGLRFAEGIKKRKINESKFRSEILANSIVAAFENFYGEYNRLPDTPESRMLTDEGLGVNLLRILLAQDEEGPSSPNSRRVVFLLAREARDGRAGMILNSDGGSEGMVDSFGNAFVVFLNTGYQRKLVFQWGGEEVRLRGRMVAVASVGADGVEGTEDDVRTWR